MQALLFLVLSFAVSNPVRAALVYSPPNFNPATARLIVVIHGCLQSAESMVLGTGWNLLAEKNNLVVLYPQVPDGSNALGCWSWYLPENQEAGSGQLRMIKDEIESTKLRMGLKNPRVFLAGISSGGAMVAGLMACYPNDFAGAAIHSGPSYGLARNLDEGSKVLQQGPGTMPNRGPCRPQDFSGSVLVIQGDADQIVNPKNANRILADFAGSTQPLSSTDYKSADLVYTVSDYARVSRLVTVKGLGHAWSGFTQDLRFKIPTTVPFFSDKGPSATQLMWEFFDSPAKPAP